eukprot:11689610-Alexandrium_andersonii.AAC.1
MSAGTPLQGSLPSQSETEHSEDPVQCSSAALSEEPLLAGVAIGGWGGQASLFQQATRSGTYGPRARPPVSLGLQLCSLGHLGKRL